MLADAVVRGLIIPLKTVPIALLVVFAGLFALLGVFCRKEGRAYTAQVSAWFITAACALAAGKTVELPVLGPAQTRRRPKTTP